MTRKKIEDDLGTLSLEDFSGEIGEVITWLSEVSDKWSSKYENVRIYTFQDYDNVEITLYGTRLENDKEYNARMVEEKKKADAKALRLAKATERAVLKQKQHAELMKKLAIEGGLPENTDLKSLKDYLNSLEELA
jgi:hypothetical protein